MQSIMEVAYFLGVKVLLDMETVPQILFQEKSKSILKIESIQMYFATRIWSDFMPRLESFLSFQIEVQLKEEHFYLFLEQVLLIAINSELDLHMEMSIKKFHVNSKKEQSHYFAKLLNLRNLKDKLIRL